jgi:hypothetical protein
VLSIERKRNLLEKEVKQKMTNFKKQAFSVLAAGSLLMGVVSPAFASTTIEISGNGAGSTNYSDVQQTNTNTVSQSNTANVTNNVTSNANTGHNDADFNTGGNVEVGTGNAKSTANVTNNLNSNAAQVAGCNCAGDTDVTISGNGAGGSSNNTVSLSNTNTNTVGQSNVANVTNNVNNEAKTGDNSANSNTGGNVKVHSGSATSNSTVNTTANSNIAEIGNGSEAGAGSAPSATFKIVGNGAGSANWIDATLNNTNTISQGNTANLTNNVSSKAYTGDNDADFNTNGDVMIGSGNALSSANVDNMTNFNAANVDCGCTFDVVAKIANNGANPEANNWWDQWCNEVANTIKLNLGNTNTFGQGNVDNNTNNVGAKAYTGANSAFSNTGDVTTVNDPSIGTGGSTSSTDVNNSGNVNTIGSTPMTFPTIPVGNTNVGVSFNVQALLAFFGLSL